jgi:hypothetical protein
MHIKSVAGFLTGLPGEITVLHVCIQPSGEHGEQSDDDPTTRARGRVVANIAYPEPDWLAPLQCREL